MKNKSVSKKFFAAARISALAMAVALAGAGSAATVELVSNGGFELGLNDWTVTNQSGSEGSWYWDTGTFTPLAGFPTVGPKSGNFYAVSDQVGPGAQALTQSITVDAGATSVIFSFDMFINDESGVGPVIDPAGLDFTVSGVNQFATVDLLASGTDPLSTTTGVLSNFFVGATSSVSGPNPYISYSFDITSLVAGGGVFDLRFAEVNNSGFFNVGIDDVSVLETTDPGPEPATLSLLGMGLVGMAVRARRKKA